MLISESEGEASDFASEASGGGVGVLGCELCLIVRYSFSFGMCV